MMVTPNCFLIGPTSKAYARYAMTKTSSSLRFMGSGRAMVEMADQSTLATLGTGVGARQPEAVAWIGDGPSVRAGRGPGDVAEMRQVLRARMSRDI